MDVPNITFCRNRDWDPSYLKDIVTEDFYEFQDLWNCSNLDDYEIVQEVEKIEKYCPIIEDISLDDEMLCSAVEKIEQE